MAPLSGLVVEDPAAARGASLGLVLRVVAGAVLFATLASRDRSPIDWSDPALVVPLLACSALAYGASALESRFRALEIDRFGHARIWRGRLGTGPRPEWLGPVRRIAVRSHAEPYAIEVEHDRGTEVFGAFPTVHEAQAAAERVRVALASSVQHPVVTVPADEHGIDRLTTIRNVVIALGGVLWPAMMWSVTPAARWLAVPIVIVAAFHAWLLIAVDRRTRTMHWDAHTMTYGGHAVPLAGVGLVGLPGTLVRIVLPRGGRPVVLSLRVFKSFWGADEALARAIREAR